MNKLLSILIIVILFSCSAKKSDQKDEKLTEQKAEKRIEQNKIIKSEESWTDYNTKDSIPELLNKSLNNMSSGNFELADPNEKFNATDVILDSLPRQKLNLLSKKGNKWRLAYIQGGFGKYYVFIQCQIDNDSIYDFKIAESILKLNNNDSIDKYISEKKLKLRTIKIIQ